MRCCCLPPAWIVVLLLGLPAAADELLWIHEGDLPIVISAPHGGQLPLADVPPRQGAGLPQGASGFFTGRDGGTEELAQEIARELEERFGRRPCSVVSRVHRRYVDFNRPPEIAVEHAAARLVYDQYHAALKTFCGRIRRQHGHGLLIDVHGQGSSSTTVYRGTKNGLTMALLRQRFGDQAVTGAVSLTAFLKQRGWQMHPDPHDGREQAGFTGGFIVQTYGSHRGDGIDAIQLEFGSRYRAAAARAQTASQLADAVEDYVEHYLPSLQPQPAAAAGGSDR